MFDLKFILLLSIAIKSYADDVVSDERIGAIGRNDKNTFNKAQRRFLDDVNDETWHVLHLKDTDISNRRSDCAEETFEEKAKRYRKSLQNDGALVEYVSADALPFNKTELVTDVCKIPDKKDAFKMTFQGKPIGEAPQQEAAIKMPALKDETKKSDGKFTTSSMDEHEKLNVATTTSEKTKKASAKPHSARKASEYQFSSVEYYDEIFDFESDAICPDDVEEIILELDHIRAYDVRCEQLLEWRSLE